MARNLQIAPAGPVTDIQQITPGDAGGGVANGEVPGEVRGLLIATAGNLSITVAGGQNRTFPVPVGILPIAGVTRVRATGTTAVGISALYDV